MAEKVAIFIDGSNLYHSLKNNFKRFDINFAELAKKLCGSRTLFRIYYYNILQDQAQRPDSHREQQEFLDVLRKTPYLEVRLGKTKISQGVPVEKGIDVMIATDLLYFAWQNLYDVAILVSGDADFVYAMQAVKNMGKYVELAYFDNAVAKELLDIADNWQLLDRPFLNDLWVGRSRSRRNKPVPWKRKRVVATTAVSAASATPEQVSSGEPPLPAAKQVTEQGVDTQIPL